MIRSKKPAQLFLVLCLLISQLVSGQAMLAKLKYEEAEKAYQENNFKATLQLVDEVEKMIKGTSPKTLYLKILATQKLGINDYKTLVGLREKCGYFLEKYDNVEGIEDRYRDVYEISKELNTYPNDEVEFNRVVMRKKYIAKQEETKRTMELLGAELGKKIKDYPFGDYSLTLGMKKSEIPYSVWSEVNKDGFASSNLMTRRTVYYFRKSGVKIKYKEGLFFVQFDDTDQLVGMAKHLMVGGKSDVNRILDRYQELATDFTKRFGVDNVKVTDTSYTIDKVKYRYATIGLKKYAPSQIELSYSVTEMGGVLGTQVILTETHRVMGLYEADLKQ